MNVIDILDERGYIEQVTDKENLKKLTEKERFPFYIGKKDFHFTLELTQLLIVYM